MIINIQNIDINYICEGEGEVVIILHGWGANIDTVRPIINILNASHKVYALDLPGFGNSCEPSKVMDSFGYAQVVREFMNEMQIEKASLIGHSFGGKLSIILSSKYPELINKIVLIDSAGLIPKREAKYYFKVYSFKTLKFIYKNLFFWMKDGKKMEKFYKKFGSDDYKDSSGIMRRILVTVVNENLLGILKDVKVPTLLIWGDQDDATPLYMGKIMEREIKDSGLVVFQGAGHYSYLDDYGRFVAIIKSFFS